MVDDSDPDAGDSSKATPLIHRAQLELGFLLLVSLLFMLNVTLFFTLNTGMDLYGFYTLDSVSAFPIPVVLSTLLNVGMAVTAYAFYRWLCRRQACFTGGRWGPFTRGAVLTGSPVLLAYAPGLVLTSHGGKPSLVVVAGLMAGSLCVTHALRDPEMSLDPAIAGRWFTGALASILVFLALSTGGLMLLYYVEQMPASGNWLWVWEYEWSDLGYPREHFAQRQRDALVGFTLTGSGFMIVIFGGSMLGAILKWTRAPQRVDQPSPPSRDYKDAPPWVARVARQLESLSPYTRGEAEYVVVLNGYEIEITGSQYECLVGGKDDLLQNADLLVDKVAGDVFLRTEGTWIRLDFRVRDKSSAIRSGPFSLLCIYARNPGRRFANGELKTLLERDLTSRESFNVRDFVSQLLRRTPRLPVDRDGDGSFMHDATKVCLLDQLQSPATDRG